MIFTDDELKSFHALTEELNEELANYVTEQDKEKLASYIKLMEEKGAMGRNVFGLSELLCAMQTSLIAVRNIGLKRDSVFAVVLYTGYESGALDIKQIETDFGKSVSQIIQGLARIQNLYKKNPIIESENFRNLLLSFAEDMRVILLMIADRVNLMRQIRDTNNKEAQRQVAEEASYLYAPLAHKLGLYQLKSELEDLSLKYLEHDAYYHIKEKLNETKKARDAYIKEFIEPVINELQNMKKQKCPFEGIYDLFAIRIILDSPAHNEKMQCWQAYSIVTDMYQPNPKRLRDWISVPKSNGYECLHITVLGPNSKWVEVQIRTERMDEVAEHGLAAHWRYKGIQAEEGMDTWLASIRTALEAGDNLEVMTQFKRDLYDKEIYVFTPKGDLLKFPKGATLLDFAYHIHSKIGNQGVGGKRNGKNASIRTELHSGDTVEVTTSATQKPKQEWLNIAKSARAKSKIRLALKETQVKEGVYAKEMLERRFKNKKIEIEEQTLFHLIKHLGFKEITEFYKQIADEKLDVNNVIEMYQQLYNQTHNQNTQKETESAEKFELADETAELLKNNEDVLVIDQNLKGIDFSLSKCCNPIYGDPIFGFVTVNGGIKIHREDCPNAPELRKRFGYRVVKAKWSGKGGANYSITLRIIGHDDIGIVNNITNVLSKEEKVVMRSINIDSHDGLFSGNLVVLIEDTSKLNALIKKLKNIKGVKQIIRL